MNIMNANLKTVAASMMLDLAGRQIDMCERFISLAGFVDSPEKADEYIDGVRSIISVGPNITTMDSFVNEYFIPATDRIKTMAFMEAEMDFDNYVEKTFPTFEDAEEFVFNRIGTYHATVARLNSLAESLAEKWGVSLV